MRLCADSQITNADITWTNSRSFAPPNKLKIYQLVDKMRCTSGITKGIVDFGDTVPTVNYVILCGTNISESATVTLGYSDTDPGSPEATISLPLFTNFNQVFFLGTPLSKRYWIIDINDPDPQDAAGTEIGFLHIGEYMEFPLVEFPHTPALNIAGVTSPSPTYQEYGRKGSTPHSAEFPVQISGDEIDDVLEKLEGIQRTDHVVVIPYEGDYSSRRYRPRYGILTGDSYPYPMVDNSDSYLLTIPFEERF